jgi:hypothetical protein
MGDSMSTIINATTTNGVVIQPDNSGSLVLQTNNGTTALTISTAQNTTLAGKLTTASSGIQFSDASTQTAAASPYVLKNRIINGDMRIDQRNAGASLTPTTDGQYTLDRFQVYISQASKFSVQQNAGSVTPPAGFNYYAGITSLSAYTVGSSDYFCFVQNIEGYNIGDFAWGTASAKTITISFWVRSSLTGTFGGSIRNGAANYSYPFTYSISSANTWEQKTVTIAGPTSGTWTTVNTSGLQLILGLGVGSTNSGTAGAWTGSSVLSATSATSVVGTNGATWYITGVQLEIGSSATPFERRLYNQELANCQRYYARLTSASGNFVGHGAGYVVNSTSSNAWIKYPTTMRAAPTLAVSSLAITDGNANYSITSLGAIYYGYDGLLTTFVNSSGATQFRPIIVIALNNTTGYVEIAAEL